MANGKKLHVFIVLAYDEKGVCKVDDVYFSRSAARARVIRLETSPYERLDAGELTFHIIKKTVHGVLHSFTINNTKTEFYKGQLEN